jgi:hypothetical protein
MLKGNPNRVPTAPTAGMTVAMTVVAIIAVREGNLL